jgi:predicted DNA-binding protein with PD1-like motif
MKTVQAARGMVVVVDSGERLIASLTRKLRELGLQGGWLSGVGSVTDVELGYYDLEKKEYVRRRFSERYDSCSGSPATSAWSRAARSWCTPMPCSARATSRSSGAT